MKVEVKERKAIPVTAWRPIGWSRSPHFIDIRLTDGGAVVSLTRWPRFTPGTFLVLNSVRRWVNPKIIVRLERLSQLKKKSSDLIGNRTRDLPTCSLVPQPTTLLRLGIYLAETMPLSKRTLRLFVAAKKAVRCLYLCWQNPQISSSVLPSNSAGHHGLGSLWLLTPALTPTTFWISAVMSVAGAAFRRGSRWHCKITGWFPLGVQPEEANCTSSWETGHHSPKHIREAYSGASSSCEMMLVDIGSELTVSKSSASQLCLIKLIGLCGSEPHCEQTLIILHCSYLVFWQTRTYLS
jgi:hypothetical protein